MGVFVLLVLVLSASRVRAAVCPPTGEQAPAVVTLMASKSNPATDAWVVKPDCTVETYPLDSDNKFFATSSDSFIERVESLPTDIATSASSLIKVFASGAPLSRGADLRGARKLVLVSLSFVSNTELPGILLPSTLVELSLRDTSLTSVENAVLPDTLQRLDISFTGVKSLRGVKLPTGLKSLTATDSKLTGIDFTLPATLTQLSLSRNSIPQLDRLAIPSTLEIFECNGCGVTTVRGIKWPSSIQRLDLGDLAGTTGTLIENLEIRRSDLALFKALAASNFPGKSTLAKCLDSTAEVVVVAGKRLCVISDERFEQVYVTGNGVTPKAPTGSVTSSNSTGGQGTLSDSTSSSAPGGSTTSSGGTQLPGSGATDATADSTGSPKKDDLAENGISSTSGESYDNSSEDPSTPRKTRPAPSTTDVTVNSSSSNITLVVGVGGGVLVVVLVACVAGIVVRRRQTQKSASEDKYDHAGSPAPSTHNGPVRALYLKNDVRNDKALIPFRIEQRDIIIGGLVSQSKTSVVYKSTFQGRDVAVKQLQPSMQHDKRTVSRFMDELRTCARLDHHKIVAFVGITWSSLRDLSVVVEFLRGGNLKTVLDEQQDPPLAADWSRSWTSLPIKSKASIVQDVIEAVVYLHSFKKPILHRNVKARNVLLVDDGSAKLSGFGISRQFAEEDLTTGEVGSVAWIAPEVLRGDRYDEKADIYSLGVFMVELDRCQHPYATDPALSGQTPKQRAVHPVSRTNTQIAVLVSSGRLRPSVSSECPTEIASLVASCLSFDPADRPPSLEVCYVLRQARKAIEATACA